MTSPAGRVMLLTPPGVAALATVRLEGPGVGDFLRAHFTRPAADGHCVHGGLREGDCVIDDPVVVLTGGGTVADISVHGGAWVVRSVIDLARRAGFAFSSDGGAAAEARDGLEAEVLAALPRATTELAIRILLGQTAAWQTLLANPVVTELQRLREDRSLHVLLSEPRVAIAGVANVGKSTLANQLFAQDRAITADLPGTTRDWIGERANIDGLAITLVDTPGVRATSDPIEAAAIAHSVEQIRAADLVILVLDPTQPSAPQHALAQRFPAAMKVANKSDLAPAWNPKDAGAISIVAKSGEGIDRLRVAIRARLGCADAAADRPYCWTNRQREIVARGLTDRAALHEITAPRICDQCEGPA